MALRLRPVHSAISSPFHRGLRLPLRPVPFAPARTHSTMNRRLELVNKGTAFTYEERDMLGLRGLLPPAVETLERQAIRSLLQFNQLPGDIEKFNFLNRLKTTSQTLFYHLLINNLEQMCPIIYTPTVGKACQLYGQVFRAAEGMYFTKRDRGHMRAMLDNWGQDVAIIVVTDGSRILGLGDLGANGMGIPVGKLSLYVGAGGFNPARVLPVLIDTGTNNQRLLDDPLYLGMRHPRLPDDEYYAMFHEFLFAVKDKWPNAIVQFEDISNDHCFALLEKYQKVLHCFNDDIQGTGAVVASGFLSANRIVGMPIQNQRVVFYGAGSAAVGVADQIAELMSMETGLPVSECRQRFYLVDSQGLITQDRAGKLASHKVAYARGDIAFDETRHKKLADIIADLKPTALIGLSGQGGTFTKDIIRKMGEINDRPIIFALSNPTSNSECSAEDVYVTTEGRAVFASGSPFGPVTLENAKTLFPGQGNNMYIFPGVGFGAWLARSYVTPGMVTRAASELAAQTTPEDLSRGRVYPHLSSIRSITAHIAAAVMDQAFIEGVAGIERPENLLQFAESNMWSPKYPQYTS